MEQARETSPTEPLSLEPLPPSDADLIAASRTGDATAYDTLYRRHAAAARSLARQLMRGQAEADDVVAETFAKILDLLRAGRPSARTAARSAPASVTAPSRGGHGNLGARAAGARTHRGSGFPPAGRRDPCGRSRGAAASPRACRKR